MITVKDFMVVINYRITEGSDYGWQCYGANAHSLDSWSGDHDGYTVSIVFDTETQTVYEACAYDYRNNRAYRLFHPAFKAAHEKEAKSRGVKIDQAWDDVNYIDLEVSEDFLAKAQAIVAGTDYDARVQIPVELEDDLLFELMKIAHERDITLNQFVEEVLTVQLEKYAKELEEIGAKAFKKKMKAKAKKH
jgi:hypothetical protein